MILTFSHAVAQNDIQASTELVVSNEELVMLFVGFIVAIIGVCIFLARDVILRKKTAYDSEKLESKKDKTFEKYHSDWSDDYEDIGSRKNYAKYKEFLNDMQDENLPDYYSILKIPRDATPEEIKQQYRKLAKKLHPDKTSNKDAKDIMAEINKAYEILSDSELRSRYDKYLD